MRVEPAAHAVNVRLPLTDVTGKVRVKHRGAEGLGEAVSPLHTVLDGSDYLEWQIGYDSLDPHHPSVATGVRFQRKGETKYGIELSKILVEARLAGFVTDEQLQKERKFLDSVRGTSLEENAKISVAKDPAHVQPGGFDEWTERVPIYAKASSDGQVEIELKPKQRAVGNQAMVYVCVKMEALKKMDGTPRPAGPAHSRETVLYCFTSDNTTFLFDIVRAFGIASRQHNEDMCKILDCVLAK